MNFELEIPKENLVSFYNILHFLSKIGKEIIFEIQSSSSSSSSSFHQHHQQHQEAKESENRRNGNGNHHQHQQQHRSDDSIEVCLKAINDAKSAFASVQLNRHVYFNRYDIHGTDRQAFTCKLVNKPLVAMMRHVKKMQSLTIRNHHNEAGEYELVFTMSCEHGISRNHHFLFQECEPVNVLMNLDTASQIKIEPKILSQVIEHIYKSIEIAIDISPDIFRIRTFNHINSSFESKNVNANKLTQHQKLSSEMSIATKEFDVFNIQTASSRQPIELVFCLRELKSLLWLSEVSDCPELDFYFFRGGRPIKFKTNNIGFNVDLLMSTLEVKVAEDEEDNDDGAVNNEEATQDGVNRQEMEMESSQRSMNSDVMQAMAAQTLSSLKRSRVEDPQEEHELSTMNQHHTPMLMEEEEEESETKSSAYSRLYKYIMEDTNENEL